MGSIVGILLEEGIQLPALKFMNVGLRFLAIACPEDGSAQFMNLEHVFLSGRSIKTEDAAKDHHDVAHEVDRIVPNNDQPNGRLFSFRLGLGVFRGNGNGVETGH